MYSREHSWMWGAVVCRESMMMLEAAKVTGQ